MTELDPIPTATQPNTESAPTPGRTRKWLVGTALVAAGAVAGTGATYVITTSSQPASTQFSQRQGGPGGPGGYGMGGPRGPQAEDQQAQDQSDQAADTQPS